MINIRFIVTRFSLMNFVIGPIQYFHEWSALELDLIEINYYAIEIFIPPFTRPLFPIIITRIDDRKG